MLHREASPGKMLLGVPVPFSRYGLRVDRHLRRVRNAPHRPDRDFSRQVSQQAATEGMDPRSRGWATRGDHSRDRRRLLARLPREGSTDLARTSHSITREIDVWWLRQTRAGRRLNGSVDRGHAEPCSSSPRADLGQPPGGVCRVRPADARAGMPPIAGSVAEALLVCATGGRARAVSVRGLSVLVSAVHQSQLQRPRRTS